MVFLVHAYLLAQASRKGLRHIYRADRLVTRTCDTMGTIIYP